MKTAWIILLLLAISALMTVQAQAEGYAEDFGRWEAGTVPAYPWESVTVEGGGDFYVVEGGGTVSDKFVRWNREGANNPNSFLLLDAKHNTGHIYAIIDQTVPYTSGSTPGNGIVLRWHDRNNYWLITQVRGTEMALFQRLDGEWQRFAMRALGGSRPIHYRVEDDGETIRVKAWADDRQEPDNWQIQHKSSVLSGGRVGIGIGTRVWESIPTHFFSTLQTGLADRFEIEAIPVKQTVGKGFEVTVTALDDQGNIAKDYDGGAHLRDTTGTITPNITGNFADGRWRGEVKIMSSAKNVRIIAGFADVRGQSNRFDVERTAAVSLEIEPAELEVDASDLVEYRVTGTDTLGLRFDASQKVAWSIDKAASGEWRNNVYHTGMFGDWTVRASYQGIEESVGLKVRSMPVVTESGYMKAWLIFEPDRVCGKLMREEGIQILGRTAFQRFQRSRMRHLQEQGVENAAELWAENIQLNHAHFEAYTVAPMAWPAADWPQLGFDDGDWSLRRMPLQVGRNPAGSDAQMQAAPNVRAAFYRARFPVDDPERDAPYTLWLQYRGGVRVFINGVELARAHLPEGELDDETLAERYPLEAYLLMESELPAEEVQANKQRNNGTFSIHDQSPMIRDVPVRYEEADEEAISHTNFYRDIDKATWNRLYETRERELGPITIPPEMLRECSNVLAIELRRAPLHPIVLRDTDRQQGDSSRWFPARISRLELRAGSGKAPSALRPGAGMRVWVQDHHSRIYQNDFHPEGGNIGRIHFVTARNGIFGAQIGLRSDKDVKGLKVEISDFSNPQAAVISKEAISVQGAYAPSRGSFGRVGGNHRYGTTAALHALTGLRYGHEGSGSVLDELTALRDTVSADRAQSIYLSLSVPPGALPGTYTGTVTVSAENAPAVEIPAIIEVHDWTLPDPRNFRTVFGAYSLPIAVARAYRVDVWSEEHFAILRTSLPHLARFGGKWVDVPVLETDRFIRWVRGRDGKLRFEFDQLDRFLDLFIDLVGPPKLVNFTIMWASSGGYRAETLVHDEASGKVERLSLGPDVEDEIRREPLAAFYGALRAYMASKGLENAIYWGQPWDSIADPRLVDLMRDIAPDVYWTRRSHAALADETYRVTSTVYARSALPDARVPGWAGSWSGAGNMAVEGLHSALGWRNSFIKLVNSRANNAIHWCEGYFPPMSYRIYPTRAITAGYNGIGTFSLDCWEQRGGYRESVEWHLQPGGGRSVGSGINRLLWFGSDGLRSGIRVEVLLEGVQQAEARIFIEQALVDGILPEELAQRAKAELNAEFSETGYLIINGSRAYALQDHDQGWQPRSRRMFALAAEVAKYVQ